MYQTLMGRFAIPDWPPLGFRASQSRTHFRESVESPNWAVHSWVRRTFPDTCWVAVKRIHPLRKSVSVARKPQAALFSSSNTVEFHFGFRTSLDLCQCRDVFQSKQYLPKKIQKSKSRMQNQPTRAYRKNPCEDSRILRWVPRDHRPCP